MQASRQRWHRSMMSTILQMGEIEQALQRIDPLPLIEAGFVAFSEGRAVVPPVGGVDFR